MNIVQRNGRSFVACDEPGCDAVVGHNKFARIRANNDGWFFENVPPYHVWCRQHRPEWVTAWRARRNKT